MFRWLEQIDKENNHKINNFVLFFCYFFKKEHFPTHCLSLSLSNLIELLSWTERCCWKGALKEPQGELVTIQGPETWWGEEAAEKEE